MKTFVGIALLAVGLILLAVGFNAADAPASEISEFFTGEPTDRALMFLIGGGLAAIAGIATILVRQSRT